MIRQNKFVNAAGESSYLSRRKRRSGTPVLDYNIRDNQTKIYAFIKFCISTEILSSTEYNTN
jgi:hypothetical protein